MKKTLLFLSAIFLIPMASFAADDYIEGKIQGASYVFNKTVQPTSPVDPKVVLERDFVLQATNGKIYFMPNVPREMKIRGVNKTVRVYADDKKDGTIFVHSIMVKTGDGFTALCNWDEKFTERAKN